MTCYTRIPTVAGLSPLPATHRLLLLSAAIASVLLNSSPALAQEAATPANQVQLAQTDQTQDFAIAAQPLGSALDRFSEQTGIAFAYTSSELEGIQSPGVSGRLAPRQALVQLLAGTGISYRFTGGDTVVLSKADQSGAMMLPPVTVTGGTLGGTTEGTESYTTGSMNTATKLPLSIRETPQSVSVITHQRMDDQSMFTLNDVVEHTPGLTLTKWGDERPRFNSRGFQLSNLMIDGLPIFYEEAALSTGLLSQYDRVEIVRGASGLMEGAGQPGGSINLTRKRPTREFQGSITAGAGSWDNYNTSVDVGGPLNDQGTLRGRSVISYQDKNSFQDYRENKRSLIYGILEADLSEATTLSFGISYNGEDNPGANWVGMATWPDGSFLPISRSHSMSPSWTYWDKESKTVFAELEHRFANDWKAKVVATDIESEMDMLGVSFYRVNDDLVYNVGSYNYDITQKSVDGMLSGPFSLLGRTHELVIGSSYRTNKDDWAGSWPTDYSFALNPLDSNSASSAPYPLLQSPLPYSLNTDTEQSSLYTTARFSILDDLKLIIGGRLDWYEYEESIRSGTWRNNTEYKATREFTPYVGLTYDLNDTYTAYASGTRIFSPQNYMTPSGGLIDPQEGTNYELGIKGEYLDGRLNASLAVFQINLENLPTQLETSQCSLGQISCYATSGEVRSRGIELEISGELTDGWQIGAGYTYNYAETLEASSYSQVGTGSSGKRYGTNLPLNLLKVFTSYRLPGELNRWKVGGGVHAQSKIYTQYGVEQGGYTLVDFYANYTINRNLDATFNINNVFDKRYYAGILSADGGNYFGDPRNYMLTVKYKF
ncbi:TonB-dependent siderophore receptor [Marinobacterium sp. BA1]|uniref:TonB-dependent siderophore receptor n=1 Tax=Marinobacterium sp. BA1 TaxID=3138931 RepID=UPI0032E5AE00